MSNEMTAEEYLEVQYVTTDITGDIKLTTVIAAKHYGSLRAKEAVKEFAEELIAIIEGYQYDIGHPLYKEIDEVKHLAKQKGVEI